MFYFVMIILILIVFVLLELLEMDEYKILKDFRKRIKAEFEIKRIIKEAEKIREKIEKEK